MFYLADTGIGENDHSLHAKCLGIIGPEASDAKELTMLNRKIRYVGGPRPALELEGGELLLRIGGAEDRFDLGVAIDALPEAVYATAPDQLPMPVVDLTGTNGRNVRRALRQIVRDGDGGAILSALLTVYYRSGEWQARPGG